MIRTRIRFVAAAAVVALPFFGLWSATGGSVPRPRPDRFIGPAYARTVTSTDGPTVLRTGSDASSWRYKLRRLLEDLREEDGKEQEAAAAALAAFAPESLPEIVAALAHENLHRRSGATNAFGILGDGGAAAVPALVALLEAGHRDHRIYEVLETLGPKASPALPVLCRILREEVADRGSRHVEDILRALVAMGAVAYQAVPTLTELLSAHLRAHGHEEERRCWFYFSRRSTSYLDKSDGHHLLEALAAIGPPAATTVPVLRDTLRARDPTLRSRALRALGRIGPTAGGALADMRHALSDEDGRVRRASLRALGGLGEAAREALPQVLAKLHDRLWSISQAAMEALPDIDPNGGVVVPVLIETAKHGSLQEREVAFRALVHMGEAARPALPVLLEGLEDPHVRACALEALGELGCAARKAVPRVLQLVRADDDLLCRTQVISVLKKIQPESVHQLIPLLVAKLTETNQRSVPFEPDCILLEELPLARANQLILDDEDETIFADEPESEVLAVAPGAPLLLGPWTVRESTIWALAEIGEPAEAAVPHLIGLLDQDGVGRAEVQALARLGGGPAAARLFLARLGDGDSTRRAAAIWALRELGADAVPAFMQALRDPEFEVRDAAVAALASLARVPHEAVPHLFAFLAEGYGDTAGARAALARVRPFPTSALPSLLSDLRMHGDAGAIEVMARLEPETRREARRVVRSILEGSLPMEPRRLASALRQRRLDVEGAVELMREGLEDDELRRDAVWALGRVGPAARSALGSLKHIADDDALAPCLRAAAQRSARLITGNATPWRNVLWQVPR